MLAPVRAPPFCTPDIIERRRYGTIHDTSRARGETSPKLSIPGLYQAPSYMNYISC